MKTPRLFVVSVRWVKTPINPLMIDEIVTVQSDWIRFDGWTWFVWSTRGTNELASAVRQRLSVEDNVVVLPVSDDVLNPPDGWAGQWIWDWINDKLNRQRTNRP